MNKKVAIYTIVIALIFILGNAINVSMHKHISVLQAIKDTPISAIIGSFIFAFIFTMMNASIYPAYYK